MFSIRTSAIFGVQAIPVSAEADISSGLPQFTIVGLPDLSVRESRERIRSAIKNSGFAFPRGRVTVNLAPAHLRKLGSVYDLPIALAILSELNLFDPSSLKPFVILGELGLQGEVRAVRGVLPTALMTKEQTASMLLIPLQNAQEALLVENLSVFAFESLRQIIDHLSGQMPLSPKTRIDLPPAPQEHTCFSEIYGQETAKRALEIAAAGGHNVLLQGPPGTGKTLLARAFPSILPPLSQAEAVEVANIRSVAGYLHKQTSLSLERPFRSPHHSSSAHALIGGGSIPTPGEISLAHRGVLFLDEIPEFPSHVLEHLRQPLEDGCVTIARASGTAEFPSRFQLIATRNPCPCGFLNDPKHACECSISEIDRYQKRISGPLLDRIDLVVDVPNISTKDLQEQSMAETSASIRTRVIAARYQQTERLKQTGILLNHEMNTSQIKTNVQLSKDARMLLETAFSKGMISARGYFRIQKTARTIADLSCCESVEESHMAEALLFKNEPTNRRLPR